MAESSRAFAMTGISEARKQRHVGHHKDLMVLIHSFLLEEGFVEAAGAIASQATWNVEDFSVCDNIDLSLILSDFINFYQQRFGRKPLLVKRSVDGKRDVVREPVRRQRPDRRPGKVATDPSADVEVEDLCPHVAPIQGPAFDVRVPKELLRTDDAREITAQIMRDVFAGNRLGDSKLDLDNIVGHDDVKKAIEEHLLLPLAHPDVLRSVGMDLGGTQGILLTGPPGTGKTMMARAVAGASRLPFFNLDASNLTSKWRGESEKLIRTAFELARYNAPAVVFLDEADAILGERGLATEHEASRRCKSEFLAQLDGVSTGKAPLLFLASTNLPWALDSAFLRRFNRAFLLDLPSRDDRRQILEKNLPKVHTVDLDRVVGTSDGLSGADLVTACHNVRLKLFRKMVECRTTKRMANQVPTISAEDLVLALQDILHRSPSVWHERYQSWMRRNRLSAERPAD